MSHSADFPSESYSRYMKYLPVIQKHFKNQTISYEMLKNSVVEIKIYYQENSYKLIIQSESLNFIDFIAAIGGTLGKNANT